MTPWTLAPVLSWRRVLLDGTDCSQCKLVGLALSTYMNESGASAFPSVATLASDCSIDSRTVQRHLNDHLRGTFLVLVELGGKKGEKRRANEWRATWPTTPGSVPPVGADPRQREQRPPAHDATTPGSVPPQVVHRSCPKNGQPPQFSPGTGQITLTECDNCAGTRWIEPKIGEGVTPCPACAS